MPTVEVTGSPFQQRAGSASKGHLEAARRPTSRAPRRVAQTKSCCARVRNRRLRSDDACRNCSLLRLSRRREAVSRASRDGFTQSAAWSCTKARWPRAGPPSLLIRAQGSARLRAHWGILRSVPRSSSPNGPGRKIRHPSFQGLRSDKKASKLYANGEVREHSNPNPDPDSRVPNPESRDYAAARLSRLLHVTVPFINPAKSSAPSCPPIGSPRNYVVTQYATVPSGPGRRSHVTSEVRGNVLPASENGRLVLANRFEDTWSYHR